MKLTALFVIIATLAASSPLTAAPSDPEACSEHQHEHTIPASGRELVFITNDGQWNSNVNYKAELGSGAVFLESTGITFALMHLEDYVQFHDLSHLPKSEQVDLYNRYHAYKIKFTNGQKNPSHQGTETLDTYHNYIVGNDPSKWAGKVKLHTQVVYEAIYPNIDFRAGSDHGHFKYDMIVKPGGKHEDISFQYDGVDDIKLIDGKLVISTSVGEVVESEPYAYQIIDGKTVEVEVNYRLEGKNVTFDAPKGYDKSQTLIIDPTVIASTLSGTTGANNYGHSATFDKDGNIYTGAISFGTGYPTTTGAYQIAFGGGFKDMALSKLNDDGSSLMWATYIGGTGDDYPHSMIVNDNNELHVYGSTYSPDFPTSAGAFDASLNGSSDIAILRLSADGSSLLGSTYLGGTFADGDNSIGSNYGDALRGEIMLDDLENILIASFTRSNDFPATAGSFQENFGGVQDGVVCKLSPDCATLDWATYLGGIGEDAAYALRLDAAGNVFVAGAAGGFNFPTTAGVLNENPIGGSHDGFLAHISNDGSSLIASTYWGSDQKDEAFFVDLDNDGDVYIYGQNLGTVPISPTSTYGQANSRQFVASFEPDLTTLNFSTCVGDGGSTGVYGWAPIAFMVDDCGFIYLSGHGAVTGLPLSSAPLYSTQGFYLMVLQPDATGLEYATYYEGADHVDGGTSRFDPSGIVYQAVCTSGPFPTTANAHSSTQPFWDVGVFKIDFEISGVHAQASASPSSVGCVPFTVQFNNASSGANDYIWIFDDGSNSSTDVAPSYTFTDTGTYNVMLIAIDSASCNIADTSIVPITVLSAELIPSFSLEVGPPCLDSLLVTMEYTGTPADLIEWDFGDNGFGTGTMQAHSYTEPGSFTISVTASESFCNNSASTSQTVTYGGAGTDASSMLMPNVFSPNNDGINDFFCAFSSDDIDVNAEDLGNYSLHIFNRWGKLIYEATDSNRCWDGKIDGKLANEGVYYWIGTYSGTCENEKIQQNNGYVQLLR